jgi:hypothetical protein
MTLIVIGILHHYNSEIQNKTTSANYINVSKKILEMYNVHSGCLVAGAITDINRAADQEKQTDVAMPDLGILNGTKVNMVLFEGDGDKDYLFFSKFVWNKMVGFAIFPEEYEIKLELNTIICGWKKYKLFNKGTVIDK